MDEKKLEEIAAQLACPNGDDGISMGEKMNKTNAFITERSIKALALATGEWIAEIGPGNGALSAPIVASLGQGGRYIGMERSSDMAEAALEQLKQDKSAYVSIHAGDCMDAPIEDSSINGVMAVNLLYFIEDLRPFLMKIADWLKDDGRAVFGVRSAQSLEGMPFTRYGFHIRSLEEITQHLHDSGFGRVESAYFDEGTSKLGDLEIPVDSLIIKALVR